MAEGKDHQTDTYLLCGSTITILRSDQQTVGAYCLLYVARPPGTASLPHVHMLEWEATYGLAGDLRIDVAGETLTLRPGQLVTLPPGVPHRIANEADGTAHYLMFCAPAGFDDFVREVGQPIPATADPDRSPETERERLAVAAPRHGLTLLPDTALPVRTARVDAKPAFKPAQQVLETFGVKVTVLTEFGRDYDAPALLRAQFPPGAAVPLHSQPDPELLYVVSGALQVFRGQPGEDGWMVLGPGGMADMPPGMPHAMRNATAQPADVFIATTYGMLEFLRACTRSVDLRPMPVVVPVPTDRSPVRRGADLHRPAHWTATDEQNAEIGLVVDAGIPRARLH